MIQPFRLIAYLLLIVIMGLATPGCQLDTSDPYSGNSAISPATVRIVYTNGSWQLYRNHQPYFIKGAGGQSHLDLLTNHGGNSVRTWGTGGAQTVLDTAQKYGLTVTLGMWVMPERQGFDYNDTAAVAAQFTNFRNIVLQYRDHPALLIWGIGNELNLNYTNKKVWNAVEDLASMIHELDPNHPTMTVLSGADYDTIQQIISNAPGIDILGINSYKAIDSVRSKLNAAGWDRPYIITEWGPTGYWETVYTSWNAPVEQNGSNKAAVYQSRYLNISGNTDLCLGSYVFYWDQKQERTPTWFSMFLENIPSLGIQGEAAETVDVMQYCWTGSWPSNRAPHINPFRINGKLAIESVVLTANSVNTATVGASDPDNDTLTYVWEFLKESAATSGGGDAETRPDSVSGLITQNNGNQITFTAPSTAGNYRLFIYVLDGKGHAGTANIPFQVQ